MHRYRYILILSFALISLTSRIVLTVRRYAGTLITYSDPSSVEAFKEDEQSVKFLKEKKSLYENTEKLSSFVGKSNDFAAIFYVVSVFRADVKFMPIIPLKWATGGPRSSLGLDKRRYLAQAHCRVCRGRKDRIVSRHFTMDPVITHEY
jgi:hypothetical protein